MLRLDGGPVNPHWLGQTFTEANWAVHTFESRGSGAMATSGVCRVAGMDRGSDPQCSSGIVYAGNVRLDNREALASLVRSTPGRQPTDLEIVVAAYLKWGESSPRYLNGDFAYVLWDRRASRLLAACDPMGGRSLYMGVTPDVLVCGQRARTVATLLPGGARPNREFLIDYLENGPTTDVEQTAFQGVSLLPPGYVMVAESGRISRRRYTVIGEWPLDLCRTEQEYDERFLELLTRSVQRRLYGANVAALHLSGGLDSSGITCVAGMLKRGGAVEARLTAHSLTFRETPQFDESEFQHQILSAFPEVQGIGIESDGLWAWKRVFVEGNYVPDDLETYTMQQPLNLALAASARHASATVVLTGEGADQLLGASSGRDFLAETPIRFWGPELTRLKRSLGSVKAVREGLLAIRSAARWRFSRETGSLGPLGRSSLGSYGADLAYRRVVCATLRGRHSQRNRSAFYGLDVRFPFLDRALVEFVLRLPRSVRLNHGYPKQKAIFRRAMAGIMPEAVRVRTRLTPVTFLEARGLQRERATLDEVVRSSRAVRLDLLTEPALRRAYASALQPRPRVAGTSFYRFIDVESWLRSLPNSGV